MSAHLGLAGVDVTHDADDGRPQHVRRPRLFVLPLPLRYPRDRPVPLRYRVVLRVLVLTGLVLLVVVFV